MSGTTSYRDAGVDISAGNNLVERIKPAVAKTRRQGVLGNIGGFGGLFELPWQDYRQPVLVSGTDGVGTKLRLAIEHQQHATIGIDLVAMCVNDIVVTGAEPLFFLDYLATARLDVDVASTVVTGIAEGCEQAGAALIGGETAEMPGMYHGDDYDLAGFAVGIVEKDEIIDGSAISAGDSIIGLAASGPHSNGYSLIHHVLAQAGNAADTFSIDALMAPTQIYVKPILAVKARYRLKGLAHITGGGLTENLPRVLPDNVLADIDTSTWERAEVFRQLASTGNIAIEEMYRVFNCGIGMAVIVDAADTDAVISLFGQHRIEACQIGTIESRGETPGQIAYQHMEHF